MNRSRTLARSVQCLGLAVVAVTPSSAWALCPNCLGQSREFPPTLKLVGGFLLVPFVIAYVAQRIIRRACRSRALDASGQTGK